MKITWIGHSCFKIESENSSIIIDPYADGSVPGLKNVREEANALVISHDHFDHNAESSVKVLGNSDLKIEEIPSYHDDAKGAKRGLNKITIITDGKTKVAHLGDLGAPLDDMSLLSDLDVMLIPVGGFYTIDGHQAAEIVKKTKPRIAIPMHFSCDAFGFKEISNVDIFLSHLPIFNFVHTSSIDTEDYHIPSVVVLNPKNAE